LEAAQRKVEGNNFDIRKHLLEYDDVINKHRQVIYKKRREILEDFAEHLAEVKSGGALAADKLESRILEMVEKEIEQTVYFHTGTGDWNSKEIEETVVTIFPMSEAEMTRLRSFGGDQEVISTPSTSLRINSAKNPIQAAREGRLEAAQLRDEIIKFLFGLAKEKLSALKNKVGNPELWLEIERGLLLRAIDLLWVEHLVSIDHLRTGIGLRGYGQRDPLVEYKKETYRLFGELLNFIQKEVAYSIYKIDVAVDLAPSLMQRRGIQLSGAAKELGGSAVPSPSGRGQSEGAVRTPEGQKVGRNDPCPCGSGKKYKKCHGK
jgi:preprotein translocase subunit SecA